MLLYNEVMKILTMNNQILYCSTLFKIYSRSHEKIAITVQRSPFERRSAFTVHGNDVHF